MNSVERVQAALSLQQPDRVPVLEFGLFILVLVLRPSGLLGEK